MSAFEVTDMPPQTSAKRRARLQAPYPDELRLTRFCGCRSEVGFAFAVRCIVIKVDGADTIALT